MARRVREKCHTVSAKSCRRSISNAMRTCSRCGNAAASISPRTKRSSSGQSGCIRGLAQLVRVPRGEVETVDRLQRLHLLEGRGGEGRPALEGVQHDALEQIPERQVELGGERLEHLEQTALEAHSGLGTGDVFHGSWYQVTKVPSTQECGGATATPETAPGAWARGRPR